MRNPRSLGRDNIRDLINLIKNSEDSIIGQFLAPRICTVVPPNQIKELTGLAPYLPIEQQMGSSEEAAEIGYNDDPPQSEFEISDRKYRIRRLAHRMPYNKKFQGSDLYKQVKDEYVPTVARKVHFKADVLHLAPILKGDGKVAQSRNVKTRDLAAKKWSDETTKPLEELEKAVDDTGADFAFFGRDVAQALQKHPQITGAGAGSGKTRLTRSELVEFLSDHLGVSDIVIGANGYQNGAPQFELDLKYGFAGIAYVGRKSNIGMLEWDQSGIDWDEYEDKPKKNIFVQGDLWIDFVTYDPAFSIAFKNVL